MHHAMEVLDGTSNDPLHNVQGHGQKFRQQRSQQRQKPVRSVANFSGLKVLRSGENWTSESGGEQEIWV